MLMEEGGFSGPFLNCYGSVSKGILQAQTKGHREKLRVTWSVVGLMRNLPLWELSSVWGVTLLEDPHTHTSHSLPGILAGRSQIDSPDTKMLSPQPGPSHVGNSTGQ